MKVSNCKSCPFFVYVRWTHAYQPKNYHAIGMSHVYGYCKKYEQRCSWVKKCEKEKDTR